MENCLSPKFGRSLNKDIPESSPKGENTIVGREMTAKCAVSSRWVAIERDVANQEMFERF